MIQDQKTLDFIKSAELVHGVGTYDYSKSVYVNSKTKLEIRCPKHDLVFTQTPGHHVNKKCRCPKCGRESGNSKQTKTTEDFIKDAKALHGKTYNYDKSVYVNKYTNLIITCPIHGDFEQTPSTHLRAGSPCGCPLCGHEKIGDNRRWDTEDFIKESKEIHGADKFDYSKVKYVNDKTNVILICKKHNKEFEQTPCNHKKSVFGCPDCASDNNKLVRYNTDEYIKAARNTHGELYSYEKSVYTGMANKIEITCKKHGSFWQEAAAHVKGQGCPNCCSSKGEIAIKKFLDNKNIKYTQQKTFGDCKHKGLLKFDFYLDDYNTVVEFHGRQHFEPVTYFGGQNGFEGTRERDKIKKDYCDTVGIKLVELTDPSEESIFKVLSIYD